MTEAAVVVHLDRSSARLAAPRAGVLYEGRVARVHRRGDGLRYPWGEEHRDAEELANLVAQLPGKPVVAPPKSERKDGRPVGVGHPEDLLKNGAQHEVVGKIISARVDGDHAIAEILIFGADTLDAIEKGEADELSLGYTCRTDDNGFQRGTYVDHLAVVGRARCGASCALRTDETETRTDCGGDEHCACRAPAPEAPTDAGQNPESMRTSHVDQGSVQGSTCKIRAIGHNCLEESAPGAEVQMNELEKKIAELTEKAAAEKVRADQAEALLQSEKTRADQAVAERDQARVDASNAKKDLAAETARADQAETDKKTAVEKARTDAAQAQSAFVAAQVKLISEATPIIGKDAEGKSVDLLAMDERAIKVAVVKHVDGDEIEAKESLDYVNGMYAGALKRHAKTAGSRADARSTITTARRDAETATKTNARDAEKAALDAMNHDTSTAYLAR